MLLGKDAYVGGDMNNLLIQATLIEAFVDGVKDNGVARKLIRENPSKSDQAVALASAEQQADKAFNIRRRDEPMEIDEVR